jgi:hemerythrin-like domain-containing protein
MLLHEHRLIERVLDLMKQERDHITNSQATDIIMVERCIDFLESYGSMTHRVKEETILFPMLLRKDLGERVSILNGLLEDHAEIKQLLDKLASARDAYTRHEEGSIEMIKHQMDELVGLHLLHFKKEEERLFPLVHELLTEQEERELVERFHQLNRDRIHAIFEVVVGQLEERQAEGHP